MGRRCRHGQSECLGDHLVAVVEDLLHRTADEELVDDRREDGERQIVVDAVAHLRTAGNFDEIMAMMPATIGPFELNVAERRRRVEGFDEGAPVEGDAVEAQFVVDQRTGSHLDRARCGDVEVQKRRGDALEVTGVGEEGEDLLAGPGQKERSFETVGHGTSLSDQFDATALDEV